MSDDIIARAEAWQEDPFNGDSGKEIYDGLVAELKTTRAQLETLRAGLTRVEHFARIQALSERVRTGPAHSTYHCEERYWLDLLALIERAEVADV